MYLLFRSGITFVSHAICSRHFLSTKYVVIKVPLQCKLHLKVCHFHIFSVLGFSVGEITISELQTVA